MRLAPLSLAAFLFAAALSAQAPDARPRALPNFPAPAVVSAGDCASLDDATKAVCTQATQESYRYLISAYQHRQASFDWSLTADKVIFVVVLILVFSGLVFAAIQFRIAAKERPESTGADPLTAQAAAGGSAGPVPANPFRTLATELEISAKGIKVQSSVLGVLILLISMAFFYLYARYVYPIQEVSHSSAEVVQGPAK